ncbi:MAG: histidine kinase dimerization/phospho-acceptor domain-containing protein [Candidatus Zixiibacteriota bacterium]
MRTLQRTTRTDFTFLLASGNQQDAGRIEAEIKNRYPHSQVTMVTSSRQTLDELRHRFYDAAVVDATLAESDCFGIVAALRQDGVDTPIIVLSEDLSGRNSSEVLNAGADQCLIKEGSYYQSVPRVIEDVCRYRRLILETRRLEEKLQDRDSTEIVNIVAGTLSHEINNPLMTILGTAELLVEQFKSGNSELQRKLQVIQQSARRIQLALATLVTSTEPEIKVTASGRLIDTRPPKLTLKRRN